eukprot:TRINITY_DN7719_c0_g1_i5.p3 TRINITY_DN7719_c0_g1~~TRINITY_DN7719_c0_g1_i5.p3  ORF type:complete len:234 (-),score=-17.21 TRINITY_DN7719_c0_g1_i5:216-917(-)
MCNMRYMRYVHVLRFLTKVVVNTCVSMCTFKNNHKQTQQLIKLFESRLNGVALLLKLLLLLLVSRAQLLNVLNVPNLSRSPYFPKFNNSLKTNLEQKTKTVVVFQFLSLFVTIILSTSQVRINFKIFVDLIYFLSIKDLVNFFNEDFFMKDTRDSRSKYQGVKFYTTNNNSFGSRIILGKKYSNKHSKTLYQFREKAVRKNYARQGIIIFETSFTSISCKNTMKNIRRLTKCL